MRAIAADYLALLLPPPRGRNKSKSARVSVFVVVVLLGDEASNLHLGRSTQVMNLTDRPLQVFLQEVGGSVNLLRLVRHRATASPVQSKLFPSHKWSSSLTNMKASLRFGRHHTETGRRLSKIAEFVRIPPEIGRTQHKTKTGRTETGCGLNHNQVARNQTKLVQTGREFDEVVRNRRNAGRSQPKCGRSQPELGRRDPKIGKSNHTHLIDCGPNLVESARAWPSAAQTG